MHNPAPVLENDSHKLIWDFNIQTDHLIRPHNNQQNKKENLQNWGCRYETIEEIKEAVTKVIDKLTQEEFHGAFQKLLERYKKCIAIGADNFEGHKSFMYML